MIKFGLSGWRAILGEEFTFPRARIVCQGIAQYLRQEKLGGQGVIVGYDTRFLGERFAKTAAEVLAAHGIPSLLCNRETPSPAIAFHVLRHQLAGGIYVSAGRLPAEYNGIQFIPAWGGAPLPETAQAIEQRITPLLHGEHTKWMPWEKAQQSGVVRVFDPKPEYLAGLERHIDLEAIHAGQLRVVMDPLYGTSRGYLDDFLRKAGVKMAVLHHWKDPYFGGLAPEPTPETTRELQETVVGREAHLGLATDGNADCFGIVDRDGTFIQANFILALLVDYLAATRSWTGNLARSVATTHLIDAVAAQYNLPVRETPVGFTYIGALLASGECVMGGEESASLSLAGHLPGKDGILACLLVVEMIAKTGKSLTELLEDVFRRVGRRYTAREDVPITPDMQDAVAGILNHPPTLFAGKAVREVNQLDGCKLLMGDGSWFLIRPSERELSVRCYGEAKTAEELNGLMIAGRELLQTGVSR